MQREAALRQIEVDLRNTDIRSPVEGVVIQRSIELGQTVAATYQAPTLFLIADDLHRMEIAANIDETDVGRIRPGQRASFGVTAYPGREFVGTVRQVRLSSSTVSNVVIYTAVVSIENPHLELLPGMTANLRIETDAREGVTRVPNAALRWRPAGAAAADDHGQRVYVLNKAHPKRCPSSSASRTGISPRSSRVWIDAKSSSAEPIVLIEVDKLDRFYQLGSELVPAVSNVSLSVRTGEFLAIMGPSGSGKSTFMNVIGCLDQPTGGRYLIEGEEVSRLDRDALAAIRNRKIGFVFQQFNLLDRVDRRCQCRAAVGLRWDCPQITTGTSAQGPRAGWLG